MWNWTSCPAPSVFFNKSLEPQSCWQRGGLPISCNWSIREILWRGRSVPRELSWQHSMWLCWRISQNQGRESAYWLTPEIMKLRKRCLGLWSAAQRARNRPDVNGKLAEHKAAKRELWSAVNRSKTKWWRDLCGDIVNGPWGTGYKFVIKKLRPVLHLRSWIQAPWPR